MRDAGAIRGWRNELYPLGPAFDAPPSLLIERAAAPYFGMRSYGVHVNGEITPEISSIFVGCADPWFGFTQSGLFMHLLKVLNAP